MTKKLKDFVKQNIAPASKFGTNPTDPWSTKANISEGKLETYLKSRGINPEYVSKDQKIAHAKSNSFKQWLQNHQNEEIEMYEDTDHMTKSPTRKRLSDLRQKQSLHKEIGVAHTQPVKEDYGNENEEFEEEEFEDEEETEELEEALQPAETHPYEVHHKTKGLVGRYKTLRSASRAVDKHDNEYGGVVATYKYVGGKKTSNEELEESRGHKTISTWLKNHELMKKAMTDSEKAVSHAHKGHDDHINDRSTDTLSGRVPGGKDNEHFSYKVDLKKEDAEVTTDMIKGRVAGGKPNSFKSFKVKLRSASGGPAASGIKVSEELDEMDHSAQHPDPRGQNPILKPGQKAHQGKPMNMSDVVKQAQDAMKKSMKDWKLTKEDKYQDPQAATQTVGMEVESKKKKLVPFKKMAEDMYDAEKEDKSVQTYGKKPKMEKAEKEESGVGEKKPQAVGVMSGGTTLTGDKRDTVEIDPMMRNRPGQPEIGKKKDDKKDDKKKDDKKQEAK